jgi:excisionase family DNA binding protein
MKQAVAVENQPGISELLTTGEAAVYLRISEWTLRHWVSDKKIRFIKIGRAVRFKKAHLDRFLQDNVQGKEVKPDS